MEQISDFNLDEKRTDVASPEVPEVETPVAPAVAKPRVEQEFELSGFANKRDQEPKPIVLTWSGFVLRFSQHLVCNAKVEASMWSPVKYRLGMKRGSDNVELASMLVADVDNGTPFDLVKPKLDGLAYLVHSSHSHTAAMPKYRIVVPLAEPVAANEWPVVRARFEAMLDGIVDAATKDIARMYYRPSHPPGSTDHFVIVGEGKFFDVSTLPELPPEQARQLHANNPSKAIRIEGIEEIPPDPLNPAEGLNEVVARCKFMQEVSAPENQKGVSQALWMALVSNASRFENSDEWIHQASCHHGKYDENETDQLIERCRNFGKPITCQRIRESGFSGCPAGGCKLQSGSATKAPAGLHVWGNGKGEADTSTLAAKKSMPDWVRDFLLAEFGSGLIYVNGTFQAYENGWWPRLDEQADMRKRIALYLGEKATPERVKALLTMAKDFKSRKELDTQPDRNLICLANGTLDTGTGKLVEHSPRHFLQTKSDIEWNPDAPCSRWLQFLGEVFANDPDKELKIAFVQEWFGYCLTPDASQHKFVWMIGAGGNGKSVLLSILTHLAGPENVSNAHIERLEKGCVRAELEGKLINISSEMSADATLADSHLKQIVSGDMIEAERKYMAPYSFRPYTRMIAATNNLPRLLDLSDGFARRAIVLTFNRQFKENDKDIYLEKKLVAELPGILVWAVEGLKRLRARGNFIIPPSSTDALKQYRDESDPVGMFAKDCLVRITRANSKGLTPTELYMGYQEWCRDHGFQPKNLPGFGKRLLELGCEKYRTGEGRFWLVNGNGRSSYVNGHGRSSYVTYRSGASLESINEPEVAEPDGIPMQPETIIEVDNTENVTTLRKKYTL